MVNSKLTVLQYANTIEDSSKRYEYLKAALHGNLDDSSTAASSLEKSIVSTTATQVSALTVGDIFKHANILWVLITKATNSNLVMSLDAVGPMSIFSQRDVNYQNSIIKHNINMLDGNTGIYVYSGVNSNVISEGGPAIITGASYADNFSIFADSPDTSAFCIPDLMFYSNFRKLLDPIYSTTVRTWTASPRSIIAGETQLVIRNIDNKFDFIKYNEKCGVRLVTRFKDNAAAKKLNVVTPSWT